MPWAAARAAVMPRYDANASDAKNENCMGFRDILVHLLKVVIPVRSLGLTPPSWANVQFGLERDYEFERRPPRRCGKRRWRRGEGRTGRHRRSLAATSR
jgi:hypothetical protein